MLMIGVTSGISGFFAVLYDTAKAEDGPLQTGIGRYRTRSEAEQEARDWAMAEDICLESGIKSED